jgi:acyl carrier protein
VNQGQIMNSDMMTALAEYIATEILSQPNRKIEETEKLISSGLIDSLSLVDIAIFVEDQYQVAIDDTELNADTFDSLEELEMIIISRQS